MLQTGTEAKRADLRQAQVYAQRAVDINPDDARNRKVLAHVFIALGMSLNPLRSPERAMIAQEFDFTGLFLRERILPVLVTEEKAL